MARRSARIGKYNIPDNWNEESAFNPFGMEGTEDDEKMNELAKNGYPFVEEIGVILRKARDKADAAKVNENGLSSDDGVLVKKQVAVDIVSEVRNDFASFKTTSVAQFGAALGVDLVDFPLMERPTSLQDQLNSGHFSALCSMGGLTETMRDLIVGLDNDVHNELVEHDGLVEHAALRRLLDSVYGDWGTMRTIWKMENRGF